MWSQSTYEAWRKVLDQLYYMEVIVIILLNNHLYSIEVSVITLLYEFLCTLWKRMLDLKATRGNYGMAVWELRKNDKKLIKVIWIKIISVQEQLGEFND